MADCSICCEPYNKSNHSPVSCGCGFTACKSCVRTYLLGTTSDPHCMSCKKAWSDKFFVESVNRSFVGKEYKDHRRNLLLERELSKLPETMQAASNYTKVEAVQKEVASIKDEEKRLREELKKLANKKWEKEREIMNLRHGNATKEEVAKFIMPCPHDGCRGFLSSAYKCELCKLYACPKCLEIIGPERNDPNHTCSEEMVATAKLIRDTTRPCPKCGERIMKSNGCDQMWCTQCKTPFSWKTGKIDNGIVHNPHYYEWQRKNGGAAPRNPGDVQCGGVPGWWELFGRMRNGWDLSISHDDNESEEVKDFRRNIESLQSLHRIFTHIRRVNLQSVIRSINNCSNFRQERIDYLLKRLTKEKMAEKIIRADNLRKKNVALRHIYEMMSNAGGDIFRNQLEHTEAFKNSAKSNAVVQEYAKNINNIHLQFTGLIQYCNYELRVISATYNKVVPQIIYLEKAKNQKYQIINGKYSMTEVEKEDSLAGSK